MVTLCQHFAHFPLGSLRQADKTLCASATFVHLNDFSKKSHSSRSVGGMNCN